jgi:hypothetical protein
MSKIELYTQHDADVLIDNIDILMNEADKVVKENYEPTIYEYRSVIQAMEEFIKSRDRIVYGGMALHRLILNKNPEHKIYKEYSTADFEFYSPEPIKDLKEICDFLHKKKFKEVQGQQAMHGDTYKLFVNFADMGDISYVPLFIYNKMPTIKINGIRYIHPKFMYIDYLRMYTDPLMAFWRLEKAIPRGLALLKNFPLEVGNGKIKYEKFSKAEEEVIGEVGKILGKMDTIIHIGTYAIQFYTIDKEKRVLPYEIVSISYEKDVRNINDILSKKYKIEATEYFPYFQFYERHINFIYNGKIILSVYNGEKKCIPYRKYESGNIASFQVVLLHHLIKYYYALNNKLDTTNINNMIGEIIRTRNNYLKKNNKTIMDETIYREFLITCLGKAFDSKRNNFFEMKKKREQGRQIIYRYNPETDYDDKLPDYKFANTSGNEIKNPSLQTIRRKERSNSSEESTEYATETESDSETKTASESEVENKSISSKASEISTGTDALPPVIARAVSKFRKANRKDKKISKKISKKMSKKGKKGGRKSHKKGSSPKRSVGETETETETETKINSEVQKGADSTNYPFLNSEFNYTTELY